MYQKVIETTENVVEALEAVGEEQKAQKACMPAASTRKTDRRDASSPTAGTVETTKKNAVRVGGREWHGYEQGRRRSSGRAIVRLSGAIENESINHRARRALVRKNAAAGKQTKLRPKARQYYSDPELITDEEEDDDEDW
ncbi:hypothetical protein R3P38DRAFT_2801043 [Favolaschia claudopus]|uniref:Uncharacterized protein n=1 Tax=Favolaschia claudopus TaxID=2862362 RepID=A0AAV9ZW22_9AGAR